MKVRKKPVTVDAIQFTGSNFKELEEFMPDTQGFINEKYPNILTIQTLEGNMTAQINDWIIKGVKGEYYPCKPDIFEITYEVI